MNLHVRCVFVPISLGAGWGAPTPLLPEENSLSRQAWDIPLTSLTGNQKPPPQYQRSPIHWNKMEQSSSLLKAISRQAWDAPLTSWIQPSPTDEGMIRERNYCYSLCMFYCHNYNYGLKSLEVDLGIRMVDLKSRVADLEIRSNS